jgi:hypothetical protein
MMDPMLSTMARVAIMVTLVVAWVAAVSVIAWFDRRGKRRSTPARFDAQATPVPPANAASHPSPVKEAA